MTFEKFMNNDNSFETAQAEKETNVLEKNFLKMIGSQYADELSDLITTIESIWMERGFKGLFQK